MANRWMGIAGILGALGVTLGAFGAHILRPVLPLQAMTIFDTAVRYHLVHTLALLAVGILLQIAPARTVWLTRAAWLFLAGLVLFSGSLYGLATTGINWLGAVTPLGGVAWIAAWLALGWSFRRSK